MISSSRRWHIVCRLGDADKYKPQLGARGASLPLSLQAAGAPDYARIQERVWPFFDQHHLSPSAAALDFYRAAAAVFAADARIPRKESYDRWTRELVLHLPVSNRKMWENVRDQFTELLCFLTGDHWEVALRQKVVPRPPGDPRLRKRRSIKADAVCLLSGGLDSFVGALDAIATKRRLVLVSHNAAGSERFSSPAQDEVISALHSVTGAMEIEHFKTRVSPPEKRGNREGEASQRSRSLMFIGLGILVASALPAGTPLLIPENGFISLNIPLTYGRLGSFSTRTAHPYTLSLVRDVLMGLGLATPIEVPYRFLTKGQMLARVRPAKILAAHAYKTLSCAHPNEYRASAARSQLHCGYCLPCLIRRAAMSVVGLDNPDQYRYDVHRDRSLLFRSFSRSEDLRAIEISLARARQRADITDVLRAGPLPVASDDVGRYVQVYRNGLNEVSEFLAGKPTVG